MSAIRERHAKNLGPSVCITWQALDVLTMPKLLSRTDRKIWVAFVDRVFRKDLLPADAASIVQQTGYRAATVRKSLRHLVEVGLIEPLEGGVYRAYPDTAWPGED